MQAPAANAPSQHAAGAQVRRTISANNDICAPFDKQSSWQSVVQGGSIDNGGVRTLVRHLCAAHTVGASAVARSSRYFFDTGTGTPGIFTFTAPSVLRVVK